jgi:signal transduction histidine kinase
VEGPPMPESSLSPGYLAALQRRAVEDADVAAAFIRVTSLIDEPSALLRPEIAATVTGMAMT